MLRAFLCANKIFHGLINCGTVLAFMDLENAKTSPLLILEYLTKRQSYFINKCHRGHGK